MSRERDEIGEAIVHVREYAGNDPVALEYWARMLAAEVARQRKIEQAAQEIDTAIGQWAGVTLSPEVARAYGALSDALDGIA